MEKIMCQCCNEQNEDTRLFCRGCGHFLQEENEDLYALSEKKMKRIIDNLQHTPHNPIIWNDTIDLYTHKVEKYRALFRLPEMKEYCHQDIANSMEEFLDLCYKSEFQIAFVGTIKTGKSTLINALLGKNYASMDVTPETAVLTKFRSSIIDYVHITFYSKEEWKELWKSCQETADTFISEYKELGAEKYKEQWVGHESIYKEVLNTEIEKELKQWTSSKSAEHYFVKEIEVGISSLNKDFPPQVVFVDTPGLSDPVEYRSRISKDYIRKANAVFVCVDAQRIMKEELATIASVFSFSSHNKGKVHIIATHWDKLNNPVEDWEKQKDFFVRQVSGKGFYEDSALAMSNVMHSSAYIYNICKDFEQLSFEEQMPLVNLNIKVFKKKSYQVELEDIENIMRVANIDSISAVIRNNLVKNYKELLGQDIERKYFDIIFTLKRITSDRKQVLSKLLDLTNSDINNIKNEIRVQQENYEEIKQCKEQLSTILKQVEKITNTRLEQTLKYIKKV